MYTDPEIASVGLAEAAARARGIDVAVARADPAETARGYIHAFHGGAVKLVADRARGVLIGATFPALNRVLGATLEELAAKSAIETGAGFEFIHNEARRLP
jgi:pyruvate/2-oxoglutarate dehydrogenase complex dihydrolipoamide dehydrogenase (E3) component